MEEYGINPALVQDLIFTNSLANLTILGHSPSTRLARRKGHLRIRNRTSQTVYSHNMFGRSGVKSLQEERLLIHKKTFTKWINSFLIKEGMEVKDLFTDLTDGKKLLKLLERVSGDRLAEPNNGRLRIQRIENVNIVLTFLNAQVRLGIGPEDIVDGNPRLTLGLIWAIIQQFQVQKIEIDVHEQNGINKKSGKDALLVWCQRTTHGYPCVNIRDFTGSWRTGLAFNALIHAHRPYLVSWSNLHVIRHLDNLNYAFDVASSELGLPRLLDAKDVDTAIPDEKSIITFVALLHHAFRKASPWGKSAPRLVTTEERTNAPGNSKGSVVPRPTVPPRPTAVPRTAPRPTAPPLESLQTNSGEQGSLSESLANRIRSDGLAKRKEELRREQERVEEEMRRLEQQAQDQNNKSCCAICLDELTEPVVFVPCGHVCCCKQCAETYWHQQLQRAADDSNYKKRCPLCSGNANDFYKVFT